MAWETNIIATVFGGEGDFNTSAYDGHTINDTEFGCALPFRFTGERPQVCIINTVNGRMVTVDIVDVGPWYTNDPYWQKGRRPQSEGSSRTNHAGIDLTPAAAKFVGIDGKGMVNWVFADGLV